MVLYARSGNANFKSKRGSQKQLAFKIEVALIGSAPIHPTRILQERLHRKQVTDKI
jgi:hypothetical protein